MNKLLFGIAIIAFAGCNYEMHEKAVDHKLSVQVQTFYNENKYDSIFSMYSQSMRESFPLDKTVAFFVEVKARSGKMTSIQFEKYKDNWACYKVTCERYQCIMKIAAGKNGDIAGLAITGPLHE